MSSFVQALLATALGAAAVGSTLGIMGYRLVLAMRAKEKRRIPMPWQLQVRPLFSDVERSVWLWLTRTFFDHHVLVKIAVIRFLSPLSATEGQHSHELLKGVLCTFTLCTTDGTVIGCIDVPGATGLKASNRDLKQQLFAECGVAYAVLNANDLPQVAVIRSVFLGEIDLEVKPVCDASAAGDVSVPRARGGEAQESANGSSTVSDQLPLSDEQTCNEPQSELPKNAGAKDLLLANDLLNDTHMSDMAAARASLQAKLERNRKVRVKKVDQLSATQGIVEDHADHNFAVQWDDSFIMSDATGQSAIKQ